MIEVRTLDEGLVSKMNSICENKKIFFVLIL